ncbi:Glycine/sarcosine/betaine reductase complex component C subunit alpha [[Clostridium] ultunense Esp]|uniref:Glycine/sarcosine/betaine reductase complex component C subunit alpha n=1 Tax=[Clostridium] ultunense Esp TaxID=1288971 RepID=M1ZKD0_9FIRM|nr:glycine/sarcosine/betaine reductase complex component C subunit alpha [Schnuerera ultunensis]CCQ95237.1 Glycine/sarcosine/betaine reductase complex component C subunit alpha [[Clostridium] ultunense Esp]SHD75877.1 Glycine/sarcosine/betaine reductase complex component C subunit alpha [[Clostridium] ultunense Esp]
MAEKNIKNMIGKVFSDIADAVETGQFGEKVRVGLTTLGSEHGVENLVKGAEMAQEKDPSIEVVLIGPKVDSKLTQVVVDSEDEGYKKMEEMLDNGEIGACVTMHYSFPIGVSTVGRVVTPGKGREMIIATTTGTSSPHRVEAMVKNGINGIITAKALGIENPTVGILNVDGARQVERALNELNSNGYSINLTESMRADGGSVMRGNDLLAGVPDVMVTDTLTGNILMKVFSSYTTGGSYESLGYGYGPGIGEDYDRVILILSRASGIPVVANAISYGASLIKGNVSKIAKAEFEKANKAGLKDILKGLTKDTKKAEDDDEEVVAPPSETVTGTISGIDIMDLEDAVKVLWKEGIYAESGMGCTGPIVMVNEERLAKSIEILSEAGYVAGGSDPC